MTTKTCSRKQGWRNCFIRLLVLEEAALPAELILDWATSGSASVAGLSDVGRLTIGAAADIVTAAAARDVGEALGALLCPARAGAGSRRVFLTVKAPTRPIRAELVGDVVQRACLRAGVARVGAHRLRHAFASELLRQRRDAWSDISQVLRHSDLATTAIYAKVDLGRLRAGRAAVARSDAMSALGPASGRLPAAAAHARPQARPTRHRQLPRFVDYLDAAGDET